MTDNNMTDSTGTHNTDLSTFAIAPDLVAMMALLERNYIFNEQLFAIMGEHVEQKRGRELADLYHSRVEYSVRPVEQMWSRGNEIACLDMLKDMDVPHDVNVRDYINIREQIVDAHGTTFKTKMYQPALIRVSHNNTMRPTSSPMYGKLTKGEWVEAHKCWGIKTSYSPAGATQTEAIYYAFRIGTINE